MVLVLMASAAVFAGPRVQLLGGMLLLLALMLFVGWRSAHARAALDRAGALPVPERMVPE